MAKSIVNDLFREDRWERYPWWLMGCALVVVRFVSMESVPSSTAG